MKTKIMLMQVEIPEVFFEDLMKECDGKGHIKVTIDSLNGHLHNRSLTLKVLK